MGTIFLFPFVIIPGYYNVTDFPKTLYLFGLSLIFLGVCVWRIFYQKIYFSFWDKIFLGISTIFFSSAYFVSIFSDISSLLGSIERSLGFITLFLIGIISFLFHLLRYDIRKILIGVFLVGALSGLIGIGQKYGIFGETLLGQIQFEGRVAGTLGQYNTYGAFLALAFGAGVLVLRHTLYSRILIVIGLSIIGVGTIFSGSRLALMGIVLVGALCFRQKTIRVSILATSLIFLISVFSFGGYLGLSEEGVASVESRKLLYRDATHILGDYSFGEILFGRGAESQSMSLLQYFSPKYLAYEQINYIPDRVHLTILDTFLQFGLIGTIIFLFIFLIFPLFIFFRNDALYSDIAFILLIAFLVQLFGFYDTVNVFFTLLLIFSLIPDVKNSTPIKKKYVIIPIFILIFLLSFLPKLYTEYIESRMYVSYMNTEDEFDKDFQRFTIDEHVWSREEILARILAREIDEPSEFLTQSIERNCDSGNYVALQVCARILHIHPRTDIDKVYVIHRLLSLTPYDPVILTMQLDDMITGGDREKAKILAKYILSLFPAFISSDDNTLTEYQKRKKKKILEYYPFEYWKSVVGGI